MLRIVAAKFSGSFQHGIMMERKGVKKGVNGLVDWIGLVETEIPLAFESPHRQGLAG